MASNMTANIPAIVENHLDAIHCTSDGKIILGSSNLTGRYWNGSLWCFQKVDDAPDVEKCLTGVEISSGICDLVHFKENKVAVGLDSGTVEVYELSVEPPLFSLIFGAAEHDDFIASLDVNSDQSSIVTAGADKCVKIWDVETWATTETYRPVHAGIIWQVTCSSEDPQIFITCGQDEKILLFDRRLPKPVMDLDTTPLKNEVRSVAWKPSSSSMFAAGDESGRIAIKDIRTSNTFSSWDGHKRCIFRMSFSPSAPWLATCSDDADVRVMNVETDNPLLIYRDDSHEDFVRGLTWTPENDLVSCSWDKKVLKHTIQEMDVAQ